MNMNKMQYAMFSQLFAFLKEKDFLNKIKVTLWMIVFYQILTYIPIPGINQSLIPDVFSNKGIVGEYLDLFVGAGLSKLSIMSIGISSYITVSLLFQFLTAGTEYFKELKKDSLGRIAINNYTKYLSFVHAFCFALIASYKICANNPKLVMFPGAFFYISTSLVVATGSLITVWIADQITSRGIGNGSSIIIFVNIVCRIPTTIKDIFFNLSSGSLSYSNFFLYVILITLIFVIVVFVERINKQISVNNFYHKKIFTQNLPENYLTIKLNPAGIYPAMYLPNLVMLPFFIKNIWDFSQYKYGAIIYQSLKHRSYCFVFIQSIIIFLTSYLFAELLFNPEEKAKELKSRTIIKGIKPGKNTEEFLKDKLFYMSFYGSFYLVIICCLPSLIHLYMNEIYVGDSYKTLVDLFAISGTSFVILVGVANDFIDKVNAGLQSKMIEYAMKMLRKGGGF